MIAGLTLALDTSTASCTVALFDSDDRLLASIDSEIGRGHAEHLVPMIAELLEGRSASQVLVGCGPGSFTGLRVGLAAAHGLAIGWDADLRGFSSLALIAASAPGEGPVTVAQQGGHGELFVQAFDRKPLVETGPLHNLPAAEAAMLIETPTIAGTGAAALAATGARGIPCDTSPRAAMVLTLPSRLRGQAPKPLYARAPDARPRVPA